MHKSPQIYRLRLSLTTSLYQGLNFDDLNLISSLVYDIQQQYAREEDVELAKKSLDETLFSVFHHVISEAPVTKGPYSHQSLHFCYSV